MKTRSHAKPSGRHAGNGHGVTFDAVIKSARQTGRDARAAAMDQVVHPAVNAVRHAGHQVEQGYHDTLKYMDQRLKEIESRAGENPLRALAYAVGAGVLIGLWLRRK
jgi:hypothetical protein